jgi:hypothetical protein
MPPEHLRFGGGAAESTILPLMAVCLLIGVILTLILPREKAITPFLLAFFIIPFGQVVVLGGFHFTALRVLILAGLAKRAIPRSSSSEGKYPGGFNGIDQMVLLWSITAVAIFCFEFMEKQAFINALGTLLDTLGGYVVVRFLIPDREAMRRSFKAMAAICVIQGIPMIIEQFTHINVFGYTGAVWLGSAIRDGKVRASGTLGALTAGPLGGLLIPMFLWLWTEKKSRMAASAGLAGAMAMVITSNSSTSWMALIGSLVGLAFWRLRTRMRLVRWGLLCTLVALHLYMKAPVWALIARIDLTGSSSGYQRYALLDMTIRHFTDWWLVGTPEYVNWGWDTYDLCNQFVAVALTGGLLPLILYIAIFKRGFAAVGAGRTLVNGDRKQEWLFWCLGSTLFATVVSYFGINSGAVLMIGFFVLVTCISVATFEARQPVERSVEVPALVQPGSASGAVGTYLPLGKAGQEGQYGPSTAIRQRLNSWRKA